MSTIVTPQFAAPTNNPPAFAGVRARPGQKFAVEWVKKRLREIHRESPLNEASAHLYLLIATYVLDRRFTSEPILARELVAVMHCAADTVARARKRLMDLGELTLVDGGQGKSYVQFALLKMAGPLYAEKGGATCADGPATSRTESEVASADGPSTSRTEQEVASADGPQLPAQSRKLDELPAQSGKYASGSNRSEEEASSDHSWDVVDAFVEWWEAQYPAHRGGVLNSVCDADRAAAFTLLGKRTLERVQNMSIECWATKPDPYRQDPHACWIALRTDRSIRVVLHKDSYLEERVVRREMAATAEAERQRHIAALERSRTEEELARQSAAEKQTAQPEAPTLAAEPAHDYIDPAVGWAMLREHLHTKRA